MSVQVINLAAWRAAHRPAPPPRCPRRQPPFYWPGAIVVGVMLAVEIVLVIGALLWARFH